MATPGPAAVTSWQTATVTALRDETPRARTIRLRVPSRVTHMAGQHYIVRLTAPDGYSAARSYSVASAPDGTDEFELTVELLEGGEVSGFLHHGLEVGDELEVRGPIGGWFVWPGDTPALLIGGGSGLVPLMSMLRLARATGRSDLVRLVVSTRSNDDLLYANELPGPEVTVVHTRQAPTGSARAAARLGVDDLRPSVLTGATAYICGSAGFVDAATDQCRQLGVTADRIRTERFGFTGG